MSQQPEQHGIHPANREIALISLLVALAIISAAALVLVL